MSVNLNNNGTLVPVAGAIGNNYELPLAASDTRGGIQIGYTESTGNYGVKLDSEKAYVTVPVTDNTATTDAITASTNLPTMNTLKNVVNRTTGITSADTNYSTSMMRGISAGTADLTAGTSALTSGTIYLVYE